jgi:hypothetical protein
LPHQHEEGEMTSDKPVRQAKPDAARAGHQASTSSRPVFAAVLALVVLLVAVAALVWPRVSTSGPGSSTNEASKADRVDVVYFHRTERCQSCLWTGEAISWTMKTYFAAELASGKVTYQEFDVQKPENSELAGKFRATGSSLFLNFVKSGQDNIVQASDTYPYIGNSQRFSERLRSRIATGLGVLQ